MENKNRGMENKKMSTEMETKKMCTGMKQESEYRNGEKDE